MRPRNGNGFFNDRCRFWSETVSVQIAGIDELGRRHVGPMVQCAADGTAQIIDEHTVIAYLALGIEKDAVEDVHDRPNLHLEAGLLQHFPRKSCLECLAKLEAASREAPLSGE